MRRDILIAALSAIAGTSLIHDEPVSTTHRIKPNAGTFTPKVQQKFTRWKGARKVKK